MKQRLDATAFTGFSLDEARARLAAAGVAVTGEVEVLPPGDFTGTGETRVVKLAPCEIGVRIYFAHRTYHRPPREDAKS